MSKDPQKGISENPFLKVFNKDGSLDQEMLEIAARASHQARNEKDMEKALELSRAGWTPELTDAHTPHPYTGCVDVMSWFWRSPPHTKTKKGKLYRSTEQAWKALKNFQKET